MKRAQSLLAGLMVLFAASPDAAAQFVGSPDEVRAQGTAYRTFHLPGERTVTVQLLGDIASGIYVVGAQTNLLELLILAGGAPIGEAGGPRARVQRIFTVRLLRGDDAGMRQVVYEAQLQEMLRQPGAYPALRDGDLITVEMSVHERFDLYRTLQVISSLGTVTLLVIRLVDLL